MDNGQQQASYIVSADTATMAFVTVIFTITGSTDNGMEQDKYRISTAGVLTPLSVTFTYTSGTRNGLTENWTYN